MIADYREILKREAIKMAKKQFNDTFIPLFRRDLLAQAGVYYEPSTLRKWKQLGRYEEFDLFRKLGGRLFLRLEGWQELCRKNGIGYEVRD
jgi:hypothetical protein